MSAVAIIAANTLRQTVRERLFYNVAVFGLGMVLLGMVMGSITFGYPDRVVRSVGLSGLSIALDLMGLLVGVGLVYQEIDRKTLFVVLVRPVQRWQYVAGRYLGLLAALFLSFLGLAAVFMLVLISSGGSVRLQDLVALGMCFPEAALLAAVGLVLSCFSTPLVASGMGLGIWIASATTDDLLRLTAGAPDVTRLMARLIYYLLPSLARFNLREVAVYADPIPWSLVGGAGLYALIYGTALVALASFALSRREML